MMKSRVLRQFVNRALMLAAVISVPAYSAELPVPCLSGNCGSLNNAQVQWLTNGVVDDPVTIGNTMTITQRSDNAVLNWRSFNISADGTVNFVQPDSSSIALNRIFDTSVSRIQGALNANGQVYLLNQNGILFGQGSKVNVGGLVASSLNMAQDAVDNGILNPAVSNDSAAFPAFELFHDENGVALPSGAVHVESGAQIATSAGGQVLMFAPEIVNRGSIKTPEGQTILAAGDSVYLLASKDENLRGILVEVGVGGTVINGEQENASRELASMVGEIVAERGNVTLAGVAVQQLGRVSATTSVRRNGSIRLQARDGGAGSGTASTRSLVANNGGELTLGERSVTEVTLDASEGMAIDATKQLRSSINLDGRHVNVLSESRIIAPGGDVTVTASEDSQFRDPTTPPQNVSSDAPSDARIYIASDAVIDVSGADAEVAMERNSLRVELRGNELRDSPMQRDGALRGQPVYVDIRNTGTRPDGTTWYGSPIADLSGNIGTVQRDVFERNSIGGNIKIGSSGDIIVAPSATLDVSGGQVRYADGYVLTSQLLGADGRIYDIGTADREREYLGTASGFSLTDPRWGMRRSYVGFGSSVVGRAEEGYLEGKDAGEVAIVAPRLILDGEIVGETVAGRKQRRPTAELAAGTLFRPFDQLPRGARLQLGGEGGAAGGETDFLLGDVVFGSGYRLPGLTNADGSAFNPITDDWIAGTENEFLVRRELLGEDGASELTLFANGRVAVPEGEGLVLPAGGAVNITALNIDVDGNIIVPAGAIDLIARRTVRVAPGRDQVPPTLTIGPNATLAARGAWVNDDIRLNPEGAVAALHVDGGEISLTVQAGGALTLETGSVLDVSGGAWRTGGGDIRAGSAGSIKLTAQANTFDAALPGQLTLNGDLRAFALERGGSLTLEASGFCISLIDCEREEGDGTLNLAPQFFEQGGFGSFELIANHSGLTVTEGTHLRPRQQNFQITRDSSLIASGTAIEDFTQRTLLSDVLRQSTDLSLAVAFKPGNSGGTELQFNDETFLDLPVLSIARGASIETDPGAAIQLASNTSILLGGSLISHAGDVSLTVNTDLRLIGVAAAQGIWLGEQSRIDVSGVARLLTSDIGRISGEVLAGGTVRMSADRGYVVTQPGATINISGTAAMIDVQASPTSFTRREIGSDAGVLDITAAEGVLLNADLRAQGGVPTHAGGQFRLTLSTAARDGAIFDNVFDKGELPSTARNIILTDATSPIAIEAGARVPDALNGRATLNVEMLESSGFDDVALTVRNTTRFFESGGSPAEELGQRGRITFAPGVDFSVRSRLQLDAGILDASGAATLSSSYVALTNTLTPLSKSWDQDLPTTLASGTGRLSVFGRLIDVQGAVAVENAEVFRLESSGDLRLRGVVYPSGERFNGSLLAAGDIELHAAQIYPSTMTDFRVATTNTVDGEIRTSGGGATPPLLSAAGRLTLEAPTIRHGGTLRSPFGTIELVASNEVVLQPGSVVSTRADTTIPFGVVQGGFDWTYTADSTVVFGEDGDPIPSQQVSLQSDNIDFQQGATIDVSAGGELQAYEWIPGVGGSIDVLSAFERPNQYAIIPTSQLAFAPYDDSLYSGSTLRPGDSIYLAGGGGIAAGTYTLMPARYALLPGAYLVTGIDGYRDITAGQTFSRIDGSTVVAGYRTMAGTNIVDSRFSGFAVSPGSVARAEAQYDLFKATEFFTQQALAAGTPVGRLANDAGRIALTAGSTLNLDGNLRATAGENGRGAALDISASRLRVVNAGAPVEEGIVNVDAGALSALGAESLLLGGRRQSMTDGTSIDVTSGFVEIAADVSLTAPELLLSARDTVTVGGGAVLTARGEAAGDSERLLLNGDSALLRVSQAGQVDIRREGAGRVTGTLDVATTARLGANGGSVTVDSSMDTISLGQLELQDGSLGISASRISLGVTDQPVDGLLLAPDQFSGLGLQELALRSRSSIDFYGNVQLAADRDLTLDAAALTAASAGTIAQLSGERVTLTNRSDSTIPAVMGDGQITIGANEIALDSGTLALNGFATARLAATGQIIAVEDGSIQTASALDLDAARIIGAAGVEYSFTAGGALGIYASSTVAPTAEIAPLGASLAFTGSSIRHQGRIETPSGIVAMRATGVDGDVVIAGGSILAQGRQSTFDGVTAAAPAGSISLTSNAGDVLIESGSLLDVSAATGGDAGRVTLSAIAGSVVLNGQLAGGASDSLRSGEFIIDALSVGDLTQMNSVLSQGGFFARRSVRQRGAGDLVLAAGADWRVHDLDLTADQGNVHVFGNILGNGAKAGTAILSARDNVVIAGNVDLSAAGVGQRGGRLEVRSSEGGVFLQSSSNINVASGAIRGDEAPRGGTVHVRLARDSVNTLLNADNADDLLRMASTITGSESVTIEGYQIYESATGTLNASSIASMGLQSDATDFMNNATTLMERLGFAADSIYRIVPGIEISSTGPLTLTENWNLASWRFGADSAPGVLTLRSAGDLSFNGSLSDGFLSVTGADAYRLLGEGNESWSYRLIAGADTASSDVLAVLPASAKDSAGQELDRTGNVIITALPGSPNSGLRQRVVRTGTGSIEVAARRDFDLTGQKAVLYTAGVSSQRGIRNSTATRDGGLAGLDYPIGGGDISIYAQRNVDGADSNQLFTSWLWRAGGPRPPTAGGTVRESSVAWTVSHQNFEQNVGALGGGNIQIEAGQDITTFSTSIPSIGRQVGGSTLAESVVEVIGGGSLELRAGNDILGGTYFTGLGATQLHSGGSIGPLVPDDGSAPGLAPVFAVGDGLISAHARQDMIVETIVNPTLISQRRTEINNSSAATYFSTYGASAAAELSSASGNVEFGTTSNIADLKSVFTDLFTPPANADDPTGALQIYPSRLLAASFSGDIRVGTDITLYPSSLGNLQLFAENDLVISALSAGSSASIVLPDTDPLLALPTLASPQRKEFIGIADALGRGRIEAAAVHGALPLYSALRDEVNSDPIRLVARTGDVRMDAVTSTAELVMPKRTRVVAGRDILGLSLRGQNLADTDVTSVIAGRDIRYVVARGVSGELLPIRSGVELAGPGYLEVRAGRNVDLQTSAGITTVGSQNNPALPDSGASISVLAGVNGSNQNNADFVTRYLELGSGAETDLIAYIEAITGETDLTQEEAQKRFEQLAVYRSDLVGYVERRSGQQNLSAAEALAIFRTYSASEQQPLVDRIFFNELRASGQLAADPNNARFEDYSRAYSAIETLYPGANPDLDAGETNPYAGDINLYFSRIFTLNDGNISLFAPGGEINAGLATPPSAFGIEKGPDQLGIVARQLGNVNSFSYGDFNVNESRVFSADGDDILVWSTRGDIDAGRGSKTAVSAPTPTLSIDIRQGTVGTIFRPALAGSGIRAIVTTKGRELGNVDLYAPRGVINAGDAGIACNNCTFGATAVLGADNIDVGGIAIGVPVDTGGLGATLASVSAAASSAASAATSSVDTSASEKQEAAPLAETALSWLEVFVVGLGEEGCRPDDVDCLKRQRPN